MDISPISQLCLRSYWVSCRIPLPLPLLLLLDLCKTNHHPPPTTTEQQKQRRTNKHNQQHNKLELFLSKNPPLTQESERTEQAARSPTKRKIAWWKRRENFSTRHRLTINKKMNKSKRVPEYWMVFTVARPLEIRMRTSSLCENCWMGRGSERQRETENARKGRKERGISEAWNAEWLCEVSACAKPYMQTQCAKQQLEKEWITHTYPPTQIQPRFFCPLPSSLFLR